MRKPPSDRKETANQAFIRRAEVIDIPEIRDAYEAYHHAIARHGTRFGYTHSYGGKPVVMIRLHDGRKAIVPLLTLQEIEESFKG